MVISATAAGCILAGIGVGLFTREPLHPPPRKAGEEDTGGVTPPPDETIVACPLGRQLVTAIATVCCVSALYNCGSATFAAFFGPLSQDVCGLNVRQIGLAHTMLASVSFVTSTLFAAP